MQFKNLDLGNKFPGSVRALIALGSHFARVRVFFTFSVSFSPFRLCECDPRITDFNASGTSLACKQTNKKYHQDATKGQLML